MAWTQVAGGWQRIVSFPTAPVNLSQCTGAVQVLSLVNGDSVTYDSDGPNFTLNADKTVTVVLPDAVVQRILAENGAFIQIDVREPTGALNTLMGGMFKVNASGTDLEPVTAPNPRAALKQAIADATTIAGLKTAVLNYVNAIDP